MNKTPELLPCPICGSEHLRIFHDDYVCSCKIYCECGCSVEWADDCMTENELEKYVVEKWNTRTQCPECEKKQKLIKNLSINTKKLVLIMRAGFVEMQYSGSANAMLWIVNALDKAGSIPDVPKGTSAQEFFDKEMAKIESSRRNG